MQIMSAREVSRYIKVNEKRVYALVRETDMPSTWIGGKLTFAKELIDKWILGETEWPGPLIIAGCGDELVKGAVDRYNDLAKGLAYYSPVGSIKGLKAVAESKATMACIRLPAEGDASRVASYVDRYLGAFDYTLVTLFFREEGIIMGKSNPMKIKTVKDLAAKGARFVNRRPDSGTRARFDSLLEKEKVSPKNILGYDTEVDSDFQVGLQVLQGEADAGFGSRYMADMMGLGHVGFFKQRIAMVIPKHRAFAGDVKRFLEGV